VVEDVGIDATRFFQGVGEDRNLVKTAFLVDRSRDLADNAFVPRQHDGIDPRKRRRRPEDVVKEMTEKKSSSFLRPSGGTALGAPS